jgi:hypothetical protein
MIKRKSLTIPFKFLTAVAALVVVQGPDAWSIQSLHNMGKQCEIWLPEYHDCMEGEVSSDENRARCAKDANNKCAAAGMAPSEPSLIGNDGYSVSEVPPDGDRDGTQAPAATDQTQQAYIPTQRNGNYYQSKIADLKNRFDTCEQKLKQTATCCGNPMSCLTGDGSEGANSGVMMALQVAAGAATNLASISGSCGTLGQVSTGMAAINAALAFKCTSKINQCNASCKPIRDEAIKLQRECGADCATKIAGGPAAYRALDPSEKRNVSDDARNISDDLRELAKNADDCDTWGGKAVEQQSQAIASLYAAKIAGLCKKQSTTDPNSSVANNAFNVNCSDPTNAANPVCQNQCNRANAANDPVCAQLLGLGTSGFGTGSGTNLADASATGAGSGSIDEFEDAQSMIDANIQAQKNSANVGGGGGGGGVPSGASSSGGDSGGAGGGDGGSGLNTAILGGTKSGSGYSQPFVRSSMGGGGYSASGGGGRGVASEGKPFNPRDFLPGGKMDPKRKLAGLASASPEIGAVHGNIFTNITNRFLQVCLRDGLFDCETLRKNSKPRN